MFLIVQVEVKNCKYSPASMSGKLVLNGGGLLAS